MKEFAYVDRKEFEQREPITDPNDILECGVPENYGTPANPRPGNVVQFQKPSNTAPAPTEVKRDAQPPQEKPAAIPAHDKEMARRFLTGLDPNATKFTFQFFADSGDSHGKIFHGTLDEVWPNVLRRNTPQYGAGAFVVINETDLKGRTAENIVRVRSLFSDADDADDKKQSDHCVSQLNVCGVYPSMMVKSGRGFHFYFLTDVPLDQFSKLQKQLIAKLGTDPAVHDLPRVMRLPGTLHLKDPTKPLPVYLHNSQVRRWQLPDLVLKLGLQQQTSVLNQRFV